MYFIASCLDPMKQWITGGKWVCYLFKISLISQKAWILWSSIGFWKWPVHLEVPLINSNKFNILKDIIKDNIFEDTSRCEAVSHQKMVAKKISVTCKMDDTSLLEKICYRSKDADTCKGMEDDIKAFRYLKMLKEDADKVDTNLIYAMKCGPTNSGPTYVFKTSWYALETASKMEDARGKTVCGKTSILSLKKAFFDGIQSSCKGYKTLTHYGHTIQ